MRACISATGLVTPFGGVDQTLGALMTGRSALAQSEGAWLARCGPRPTELALRAIRQLPADEESWLLCATTGSDAARDESPAPSRSLAQRLRDTLGLRGPALEVQAACASGLVALGMAADLVESGQAPSVVVVAVDGLSRTTLGGFAGLGALASAAPAPWSLERAGLGLGEAAAALRVGPEGPIRVAGWGESCDARALARPDATGAGLRRAMDQAGRQPPDLIVCHGTGTLLGDAAEAEALRGMNAPITGTKGALGHTLGAAGGVDAVLAVASMLSGKIPAMAGVRTPMDARVVLRSYRAAPQRVLLLAAGFGGYDAALLLAPA